jgi:hypothetical protein
MTRQHRTPPGPTVLRFALLGFAAVIAGCGGGTGGGSMSGAAGMGTAGASAAGGQSGAAGAAGMSAAAGRTGAAGTVGMSGTAGATGSAGTSGSAGTQGTAGATGTAGVTGAAGATGTAGATSACDATNLTWKTGSKTNFTSYPAPGSAECIQYSGCMYEGEFAGCDQTEPLTWVMSHDIVAAFPDFNALKLHDLCLKSSTGKTLVVTVLDTCGDSDCDGCCTKNKGTADELIDVESFTDMRWGVPDGRIQWADLGPTKTSGCK